MEGGWEGWGNEVPSDQNPGDVLLALSSSSGAPIMTTRHWLRSCGTVATSLSPEVTSYMS